MLAVLLGAVAPLAIAAPQSDAVRAIARDCVDSFVTQGDYYGLGEDRDVCEHAGTEFAIVVLDNLRGRLQEPLATFVDRCIEDFYSDPDDRDYFSRKDAKRYRVPIVEKSDFCHVRRYLYHGGQAEQTVSLLSVLWAIAHTDRLTDGLTAFNGGLYKWDPSDSRAVKERRRAIEERERASAWHETQR